MNASDAYSRLVAALREIAMLGSVSSVLGWDERVTLPARGATHRAEQASLIARLTHEQFTSPRMGEWLHAVESSEMVRNTESDAAVNVRETRRRYDRAVKLPGSLIEDLSRTEVLAQQAWAEAKGKSDYAIFKPWLTKTLELKKREAECIGYEKTPYDALLDAFEPHETTENLARVFAGLRGPLVELVGRIRESPRQAPVEILQRSYPIARQEALARFASRRIGYDFQAGRLDVSAHPFCTGIGPGDTRITTRYDEHYFSDAFFGVLHETGHALYCQGLPKEHFGTPLGEEVSLGIHESQSRLWENLVGRSRAFWTFFLPKTREAFPSALANVTDDQWLFAIHDVRPSLIRTESDETTYNLHIMLRFELEQAMMNGELDVDDIPGAWNGKMREYLGIVPSDDAAGCLQDIHWAGGAIGYFPTYTLGNLYASQFFEQARQDLGDLDAMFARGEFSPLLDWLRKNIHQHGQRYPAAELVRKVTGKDLSADAMMRHLRRNAEEYHGC